MPTYLKGANFNGYNGSHFWISLWYDLSQDKTNATSTITYYLYAGSTDGYSASGSSPSTGYINGVNVGSLYNIGVNSSNYVGQYIVRDIQHDEYGEKTVNYSASMSNNWSGVGTASLSGTLVLPKIDRYSIITNAPNFNDEQDPTIEFTNFGLYDLRAKLLVGTTTILSEDLVDNTATSYTFELTTAQRNQLRQLCTGKTLEIKLQIVSVDGNTEKYASEAVVIMSMINAEPTFTYSMVETNQNVIDALNSSSASSIIDNASTVKITVSPTTYKYASVSGVSVVAGGTTYTDTTSPYEITIPVTDNIFTISVIDSRGYTTTQIDSNRTLIDYEPLRINGFSFTRESPISSNIILNADILYYDTFGSVVNVPVVKWKLDDGAYTTIPGSEYTIDSQNHKLTISNYELTNALAYNLQGQFTLYVADLLTETQDAGANGLVLKGVPTYDAGEHDLQVNGDLFIADINRDNAINVLDAILDNKVTITTDTNRMSIKFENGLLINTIRQDYSSQALNTSWGGVYASSSITTSNYLTEFTSLYSCTMSCEPSGGNHWSMFTDDGYDELEKPRNVQLLRGTSGTVSGTINIIAIGKWK